MFFKIAKKLGKVTISYRHFKEIHSKLLMIYKKIIYNPEDNIYKTVFHFQTLTKIRYSCKMMILGIKAFISTLEKEMNRF